jgi:hypothetical protein
VLANDLLPHRSVCMVASEKPTIAMSNDEWEFLRGAVLQLARDIPIEEKAVADRSRMVRAEAPHHARSHRSRAA